MNPPFYVALKAGEMGVLFYKGPDRIIFAGSWAEAFMDPAFFSLYRFSL
jgi:hypothetical protein